MNDQRATLTATVTILKGRHCIHFTAQPLAGNNHDVWFPLGAIDTNHFQDIETILVVNNIAHNVVDIKTLRQISPICKDIQIRFNKV